MKRPKIETVRIALDILVLISLAIGLLLTINSNLTARKAMYAQNAPWIEVEDVAIEYREGTLYVDYKKHNRSTSPAIELSTELRIGNVTSTEGSAKPDSLMPGKLAPYRFRIHGSPEVERMYDELREGLVPISFSSQYSDVFGHALTCTTVTRFDGSHFRNDSFTIEGLKEILRD